MISSCTPLKTTSWLPWTSGRSQRVFRNRSSSRPNRVVFFSCSLNCCYQLVGWTTTTNPSETYMRVRQNGWTKIFPEKISGWKFQKNIWVAHHPGNKLDLASSTNPTHGSTPQPVATQPPGKRAGEHPLLVPIRQSLSSVTNWFCWKESSRV